MRAAAVGATRDWGNGGRYPEVAAMRNSDRDRWPAVGWTTTP